MAGLPVERLNLLLALLTALTVSLSMRIVGLLLVSAMMVIPVACALQTARSFAGTIVQSMLYGLFSVIVGLTVSYYANLAPGGTIVLTGTCLFLLSSIWQKNVQVNRFHLANVVAMYVMRRRKPMMRADLHVHTTASDGTWTPQELITEAQK